MIHTPNRIQPMSPVKGPGRFVNDPASGVKFGLLTRERLEKYRPVFKEIPDLRNYSFEDFLKIHNKVLTKQEKARVEQVFDCVDPVQLDTMRKNEKLGVLQSASDGLFGLYILTALRSGAISEKSIEQLTPKILSEAKQNNREFGDFLNAVIDMLPADKVARFQQLVGGDSDQAKALLSVIVVRAALSDSRENRYSLKQDGANILSNGMGALNKTLPWYSPRRLQVWLMGLAYKYIPCLPVEWFRSKLRMLASERLAIDVRYDDFMHTMCQGELYNQKVHYKMPKLTRRRKNQAALPLQILYEAALLKNAALWHPDGPTLKILG